MKVLLSWSRHRSHAVAMLLRDWLPTIVNRIEPWMSSEDIEKGARWEAHLAALLSETSQGIVCVTAENVSSPWLNFEAGALAKSVTEARVRPVLLDVTPANVTGPLAHFQAANLADEQDMYKVVQSLNESTESPLSESLLKRTFRRAWPELAEGMESIRQAPTDGTAEASRSTESKVDEILELVRALDRGESWADDTRQPFGDLAVDLTAAAPGMSVEVFSMSMFRTVNDFTDHLYFRMRPHVNPFTYGIEWDLVDLRAGKPIRDIGSLWAREHNRRLDDRPLTAVGIGLGSMLTVRRLG